MNVVWHETSARVYNRLIQNGQIASQPMSHLDNSVRTALALMCLLEVSTLMATATEVATNTPLAAATHWGFNHPRNLFAEAGHPATEVKQKVAAAFEQLFHGDPATQSVFLPAGTNTAGALAYIHDVGSGDVRSEGMSYGMMIAVQLDKKAEFDALWNWVRTFMYHADRNHPTCGFFSWSMSTNGLANDEMPAPDGEEYFATALYFAAARWGNDAGCGDYHAEADQLLTDMRHRPEITGNTRKGPMSAGALFDGKHRMIRFTPDIANRNHTDPSYHLPAFYELWSRCGPAADRKFWSQAAAASREFFQHAADPVTGLTPEYANFDGTPWVCPWQPTSVEFQFDAWRTAMNWSVDWAWWGKDPREQQLSDRLQRFFAAQGMTNYGNTYTQAGRPTGTDHSTGLVAMNAVASLAATQPCAQKFVEALWAAPVPAGQWRYYDGMLYLLGLLHCSGEFKIWTP